MIYRIYEVCGKSNQMNEELSLASHLQLDADNIWETLSESLNSLGDKKLRYRYKEPDARFLFRLENEGI